MIKDALISSDKKYRYWLKREWASDKPVCTFIMLNPSTADATKDDNTIIRCINFAKSWGFGSLEVVNLFAFRATDKSSLLKVADPSGQENDYHILKTCKKADKVILAWGNFGSQFGRSEQVLKSLKSNNISCFCLTITKQNQPGHPLYVKANCCPREHKNVFRNFESLTKII